MPPAQALGRLLQATPVDRGLGAGLILLIIFGVCALTACVLACGRGPVARVTVFCVSSLCYTLLALLLTLLPREPKVNVDDGLVTDLSTFFRILFLVFMALSGLVGGVMLLLNHAMVPQKAPRAPTIERNELIRLAR
jgi:hypothetical protein